MTAAVDRPSRYFGTITGTSVDGLDLAVLELEPAPKLIAAGTAQLPDSLRSLLLRLGQPENDSLDDLGEADAALGTFIGETILSFLTDNGMSPGDIRAIGSHGQTVRHRPDAEHPFTWQIGDPNRIAEVTGIDTVADFRRRDMAAGGQGAPLVPPFHEALFRVAGETRVVLNIGGISNVTVLPADMDRPITGFDTGPGNCLMDAWCLENTDEPFDRSGQWARQGTSAEDLLATLRLDPYFSRPPPKSTGREYFNLPWLTAALTDTEPVDVQRTLLELTATTIIDAIDQWAEDCARIIVCGGGRRNGYLMERLSDLSQVPVETSETHGFDGDAMEAAAFAWLAARHLDGLAGNAAAVTGARGARVLGSLHPGSLPG